MLLLLHFGAHTQIGRARVQLVLQYSCMLWHCSVSGAAAAACQQVLLLQVLLLLDAVGAARCLCCTEPELHAGDAESDRLVLLDDAAAAAAAAAAAVWCCSALIYFQRGSRP